MFISSVVVRKKKTQTWSASYILPDRPAEGRWENSYQLSEVTGVDNLKIFNFECEKNNHVVEILLNFSYFPGRIYFLATSTSTEALILDSFYEIMINP